ncbi:hypothetical protein [Marinobacter caseinilyticus]|uniref:hypothetical protein n=1 Tax=Marinobacter caseinilyticus TaxID=2692195 RepID=UPI00140CBD15|nr:hypothetical protein [Marinobacter caseinilyticus]
MTPFSQTASVCLLLASLVFSGCASYYDHYAVFPAANSQGEPRQVRLSWQTAEYPAWWIAQSEATPITVESQCSTRVWRLFDRTQEAFTSAGECGDGIRACGDPELDRGVSDTGEAMKDQSACMRVTSKSVDRIAALPAQFKLKVSCKPAEVSQPIGQESESTDYLRASVVPYVVHARKVARGGLNGGMPALEDSVCDKE